MLNRADKGEPPGIPVVPRSVTCMPGRRVGQMQLVMSPENDSINIRPKFLAHVEDPIDSDLE